VVQELREGDCVLLTDGVVAQVTQVKRHARATRSLVELVTNQASLKISDNHRIEVPNVEGLRPSPWLARELRVGDQIIVGNRSRPLTRVRHFTEGVELIRVCFQPDGVVEAYVIPTYGLHVRGSTNANAMPNNLFEMLAQIPEDELLQAMPLQYED